MKLLKPALTSNNRLTRKQATKIDFILPDTGEGIMECEVIEWTVREGDLIEAVSYTHMTLQTTHPV